MIEPVRPRLLLDGEWRFVRDPEGRHAAGSLPDGEPITVPAAWETVLPDPYGIVRGWYHREFAVPAEWPTGTLVLRFGSVLIRAEVWLDGRRVGSNADGHLPFEVDAGPVRPGTRHRLAVRVENPFNALTAYPAFGDAALAVVDDPFTRSIPHGKQTWYSATSGLLGSVCAEAAPPARITTLLPLPDLEGGRLVVRWAVAGEAVDRSSIELVAVDPAGREAGRVTARARATEAVVVIPDPVRWEPAAPAFYRLEARLVNPAEDGAGPDVARVRFGMRSIAVRDGEILLNGRPIYLRGALDQDFWPDGISNPPSRQALEEQATLAREMGLTLLRCHIKLPDPAYLDVADEHGLLVWCELPSWMAFGRTAGETGRRMLRGMVETMGHHPSIVAWTVINEDWGTDVRHEARDRRWISTTVDWLRALDPTRLVVDNSACETPYGPNTHVNTDLADFHVYRSMPDGLPRWRAIAADYARRPAWLWSPAGDARESGHEALVLSEFGTWGLPRPGAVREPGGEPWWWATGRDFFRPAGIHRRFRAHGLHRVFADLDTLADATQWHQFEALQAQVAELRRHGSIRGYVITELTDLYWEANGLLDIRRGRKVFHDLLAELNAAETVFADLPRRDLRGGEQLVADVVLSSFPDAPLDGEVGAGGGPESGAGGAEDGAAGGAGGGEVRWRLAVEGCAERAGVVPLRDWPRYAAWPVARLALDVPDLPAPSPGTLRLVATDARGRRRASSTVRVCVLPAVSSLVRRRVAVVDPLGLWDVAGRLQAAGHLLVEPADAELVVATTLDPDLVALADRGGTLLLLARSEDAVAVELGVARPFRVVRRQADDGGRPHEAPWAGDWITTFGWLKDGTLPGVPRGPLLGMPFAEVYPDHVLAGFDPRDPRVEIAAGMFAGWVHSAAAVAARFGQGKGRIAATTFRVAPEDGPLAAALLDGLVAWALETDVGGS